MTQATVIDLDSRRPASARGGGPTARQAIEAFMDAPKIRSNANKLRAYNSVLDRAAAKLGPDRPLAGVVDDKVEAHWSSCHRETQRRGGAQAMPAGQRQGVSEGMET